MEIDIYSDVICPWCYIGKRRLEQALESFDGDVTIRYRPFQLDPTPVAEPVLFLDNLAAKVGGPARAKQLTAGAIAAAAGAGIDFRYDRAVKANTFDAHRLIWFATSRGLAAETVEALYRAFFIDGVDVGSHAALAALAAGVGLDETEVREFLDSGAGGPKVRAELAAAHDMGITSVPTFIFAGKYAVTGAQEPETLRSVLDEVARREAAEAVLRPVGVPADGQQPGVCTDDSCAI